MSMVFRIQPHVRLHEWVAEEHDFFAAEGLEYTFDPTGFAGGSSSVARQDDAPPEVRSGALEDMAAGRSAEVSCACHWAVNAAATEHHGRMYGDAYSVCPSGIYVAPGSGVREPGDLAGVEVGVGYHSGSHYSALQGLEPFLPRDEIALGFVGRPFDRVRLLLDGRLTAVNAWGAGAYVLEQRGCTKIVDTTFVMGFFLAPEADPEDVERYFRALLRAQQEIDLEPQRYAHYWAREMPGDLVDLVDVRRFGPGERVVPQPYTREMFERSHAWMQTWELLDPAVAAGARYDDVVVHAPTTPGPGGRAPTVAG
jgi:NitT/TauT family transport system substrate-binding protein